MSNYYFWERDDSDDFFDDLHDITPDGVKSKIREKLRTNDFDLENCKKWIRKNPNTILYVPETCKFYQELCELAVELDGRTIRFVNDKYPDLCRKAVRCTYHALEHISSDSPIYDELLRIAVENDGAALKYSDYENPDIELCTIGLLDCPEAIQYIINPSLELSMIALEQDPSLIRYINKPHTDAVKYVLQRNPRLIRKIKRQITEEIFQVIVDHHPKIAKNLVFDPDYEDFKYMI